MIQVGGTKAGVIGLDQILEGAYSRDWRPEQEGLGKELVESLRAAGNYVSERSEPAYEKALTEIYRKYFQETNRRGSTAAARKKEAR